MEIVQGLSWGAGGCLYYKKSCNSPEVRCQVITVTFSVFIPQVRKVKFTQLVHSMSIARKLKCSDSNSALSHSKPGFFVLPVWLRQGVKAGRRRVTTTEKFRGRGGARPVEGEDPRLCQWGEKSMPSDFLPHLLP